MSHVHYNTRIQLLSFFSFDQKPLLSPSNVIRLYQTTHCFGLQAQRIYLLVTLADAIPASLLVGFLTTLEMRHLYSKIVSNCDSKSCFRLENEMGTESLGKVRKQLQHIVLTTKTAGRGDFPS